MNKWLRFAAMAVCVSLPALFAGCEDDGDNGSASAQYEDNSRFCGHYSGEFTVQYSTGPAVEAGTLEIGCDVSRQSEELLGQGYVYIPATGSTETYTTSAGGYSFTSTVSVRDHEIVKETSCPHTIGGEDYTTQRRDVFEFSEDFQTITITGSYTVPDDPCFQDIFPDSWIGTFTRM